jgi:OmpA-OmpF porin, OOP family
MKRLILIATVALICAPNVRAEDAEGCKDHPLFSRLPGYSLTSCDKTDHEERKFNVGPAKTNPQGGEAMTATVPVEGRFFTMSYTLDEGATKKSPLQIMRNFQNAVRSAGGTVEGEYPGWCQVGLDDSMFQGGNNCANWSTTLKVAKGGHETWTLVHPGGEGEGFTLYVMEREAMKQDVAVNEFLDALNKDGFIALHINFDTAKATIKPDSNALLDQAAAMLKMAPDLKIEVAGHTDNVGDAATNQKLSEARAQSVVAALVQRGVAAGRMTAKGLGQSVPVADNRTEEGRAKNRRVELVKR